MSEFQTAISRFSNHTSPVYHFEGRQVDITSACIDYVRVCHPKALISVEIEKPYRDGLQELAQKADVVFFSKGWAQVRKIQTSVTIVGSERNLRVGPRVPKCV